MKACLVAQIVGVAAFGLLYACSDDKLKAPASDSQFDDADEPATPGPVGAVDAQTVDAVVTCASDVDCPPRAPRCFFPMAAGCGAVGSCFTEAQAASCTQARFCLCAGGALNGCAPPGLSPQPIVAGAICPETDAGAPDDAGLDAPPG